MQRLTRLLLLVLLGLATAGPAGAQTPGATGPLRVFLDCETRFCDFDFFRTEIPWVDYVRARQDADVHVMVTAQGTGSGGTTLTLQFMGLRGFAGRGSTTRFTYGATDAEAEWRAGLVRVLKVNLGPYVLDTDAGARLHIRVEGAAGRAEVAPAPFHDPWDQWTFSVGVNGNFNGETSYTSMNVEGWASANRVTDAWKLQLSGNNRYAESTYDLDDSTRVHTVQRNAGLRGLVARSLGQHLSAGVRGSVTSSNFVNQDLAVRVAPAVEYSVFPYAEATRRELTAQYSVGVVALDYMEETLLGHMRETRMDQVLHLSADFTQPWGGVDLDVEAAHYLNDVTQNRLEGWGGVNLRLVRGLQLRVSGSAARVRDQIYLPAGELTQEDVLLRQKALATGFRYAAWLGVTYTFGSIYNNVVNPRF